MAMPRQVMVSYVFRRVVSREPQREWLAVEIDFALQQGALLRFRVLRAYQLLCNRAREEDHQVLGALCIDLQHFIANVMRNLESVSFKGNGAVGTRHGRFQ